MKSVLITGVSSGIGEALAKKYLGDGYIVFGLSRTAPKRLLQHQNMHFRYCDLTDFEKVQDTIASFEMEKFDAKFMTLFLNAGTFGCPPKLAAKVTMNEFMEVFALNLMAVKATIDACIALGLRPHKSVVSSSVASIRQRAGMVSYAASKAALNAMIKTYQIENPDIHFFCLGLCNVKSHLSDTILKAGKELPELWALKQRANRPGYIVKPEERAQNIADVLAQSDRLRLVPGNFYEIRDIIKRMKSKQKTVILPMLDFKIYEDA